MSFAHLTSKQLDIIRKAFRDAGISYDADTRLMLLSRIPADYSDSLKNAGTNAAQFESDLLVLNSMRRRAGQAPLMTWLENARDRVFAGRVEAEVFEQLLKDLTSQPEQRPDTGQLDRFFRSLREEIQDDPAASQAVSFYQRIFGQARQEIALIKDYKDLHEQLHNLQMAWPDEIATEVRSNPDSPRVRLSLTQYSRLLTNVVGGLKNIEGHGNVRPEDLRPVFGGGAEIPLGATWIEELDYHQAKFDEALNDDDFDLIIATYDLVKGNLATALSNLNDKLKRAVDTMHLDDLVSAIREVCKALTALAPERTAEKVKMYESGTTELANLGKRLRELREQHDDWQEVDTQLGMLNSMLEIADRLGQLAPTLASTHVALTDKIEPIYRESVANWALDLKKSAKKMKDALDRKDDLAAIAAFQTYRAYANLRFFIIDREMKAQCDALGKVGDRLEKINDDLENM